MRYVYQTLTSVYSNQQSTFSPLTPYISLPKYFASEWSYAQYRIPVQKAHLALSAGTSGAKLSDAVEDEKCVVAWVKVPMQKGEIPSVHPSRPPISAIEYDYQLIVLTYSGGWYLLALPSSPSAHPSSRPSSPAYAPSLNSHSGKLPPPRPRSTSGSSMTMRTKADKGKEKESEKEEKVGRDCTLLQFRRFGRWDGWG